MLHDFQTQLVIFYIWFSALAQWFMGLSKVQIYSMKNIIIKQKWLIFLTQTNLGFCEIQFEEFLDLWYKMNT